MFNATRTIVVIAGKGQWIYDKLTFELRDAASAINKRLNARRDGDAVSWLEELVTASVWFDESVRSLETLLTYLDQVFVPQKASALHIR